MVFVYTYIHIIMHMLRIHTHTNTHFNRDMAKLSALCNTDGIQLTSQNVMDVQSMFSTARGMKHVCVHIYI